MQGKDLKHTYEKTIGWYVLTYFLLPDCVTYHIDILVLYELLVFSTCRCHQKTIPVLSGRVVKVGG